MARVLFILTALCGFAGAAAAEYAAYGRIELNGLAREQFHLNPSIREQFVMVCNVNGPDGFLSVRSGPSTQHKVKRRLNRLAILTVDTHQRKGRWIRVLTAHRDYTKDGRPQDYKSLHVTGWAHDGFMCDFLD